MSKDKSTSQEKYLWLPINLWNLNELFATESISPLSFYEERNFGNPVNRNQGIEDANNLILFDDAVKCDILLKIKPSLLDLRYLTEIKSGKKNNLKSFEYPKTIFLKKDMFSLQFVSQDKLNEFLNNTFMLLEVKTINKYKYAYNVMDTIPPKEVSYQSKIISIKTAFQPFFDKAFNQIKGLIYGYFIGSLGTLEEKEQNLLSNLSKLKNLIGSIHTEIVLSEQYSEFWLIKIHKSIKDCQNSYFDNFKEQPEVLKTMLLRLEEIDNLNKMRCSEFLKQNSSSYKREYENEREILEGKKRKLYRFEHENKINSIKEELEKIKKEEKYKGSSKGKSREYYKIGTLEYNQKQELKRLISKFEENEEYYTIKKEVEIHEERLRNFQFGFTQYDTSITEQFSRISEYLQEITKKATNYFLSKNNKLNDFPDISFKIKIMQLADYYFNHSNEYSEFSVIFPNALFENLTEAELQLLKVSVNSILSKPQGLLGNFSEQNILEIIKDIGEHLPENSNKQILRDYYKYRIGKNDNFNFPENSVIANIIVFLMKLGGHEQINKMLVSKNLKNRQVAFLLYGAYIGFANMPKTFTNIIFDSDNNELFNYIDTYLFSNYLNDAI